jgi:hypothetical protein
VCIGIDGDAVKNGHTPMTLNGKKGIAVYDLPPGAVPGEFEQRVVAAIVVSYGASNYDTDVVVQIRQLGSFVLAIGLIGWCWLRSLKYQNTLNLSTP